MMFLITSDIHPLYVCKAANKVEAIHKFMIGMKPGIYKEITSDPSFQIRTLTIELLDEITPEEFMIIKNTDF